MEMKFVIHYSDHYYPNAEEFDTYAKANKAFAKLKNERLETARDTEDMMCDKDYLCIVLSEIDVDKIKELLRDDVNDDENCEMHL
jgi:hypothetical protein